MEFSNFFKGIGDFFSVGSPVSSSSDANSLDVLNTQNALADLGHFNAQTPDIGEGLKSFQAENGLKVDGLMNPGGPTESALSETLANAGLSPRDPLAKSDQPLPPHISVEKKGDTGFTASASFGPQNAETPKAPPKPKVQLDPLTGLPDPLAKVSKPKADMKKAWDDFYKQKAETAKTALIPQGDTVQSRIQSMMTDKRYSDKTDPRLRDHVSKQFERAYPGEVQYDETGRMVQPVAAIKPDEVEPFDPEGELRAVSEEDQVFTHSVSDGVDIQKELESGNSQKAFDVIARIRSESEEAYQALPAQTKDAFEGYIEQAQSSEPQHLHDPKNREKAVGKGLGEGAVHYTEQDLRNKADEKGTEAVVGLGKVYGVDRETLKEYEDKAQKERDETAIPKNFQDRTIAKQFGELVDYLPGVGNLITAKEYGELAQQSGLGKNGSQAAAIAGLFQGKAGQIVSKYGSKGADYLVKSITGKGLSEVTPRLAEEIKNQLIEMGVDVGMRKVIEGAMP